MRQEVQSIPWNAPYDDTAGVLSRCQRCDAAFPPEQSRVIAQVSKDTHFVFVRCSSCFGSTLLTVVVNDHGIVALSLGVDISEQDAPSFLRGARVDVDDVIEVHRMLLETNPGRDFIDDILDHI